MEKYFVLASIIAVITFVLFLIASVLFVQWTNKLFGIEENKKEKEKRKDELHSW